MPPSRLFWKIFLAFAAIGVVAALALVVMTLRWERERLSVEAEMRLKQAAALVRPLAESAFAEESSQQARVRALGEAAGVRITLVDAKGKVLADSSVATADEVAKIENHRTRPEIAAALKTGSGSTERASATTGDETRYYAERIDSAGSVRGVLRVSLPTANIETQLAALRQLLINWAAAVIGALLLATYIIARNVVQPVVALRDTATAIAAGDYAQRAFVPSNDELGQLGEALNRLSSELGSQLTELRRSGQRQSTVLGGMVEGVVAVDERQRVLFANTAAGKLFDFLPPKAEGRPVLELIRNHDLQRVLSQALAEVAPKWTELEWGKLLLTAQVTPLPGIPCPGAVVVLHNITELRRLEGMRRDFIANVSHELKTPLSSIKAYAETLLNGALRDEENNVRFLERINEQADRLNLLIQDMLSLARIESDQQTFEIARVGVVDAVAACFDQHQSAADAKSITLITTPPVEALFVRADAEGLREILSNLIDNAIKYTAPEGRVEVRWRRDADRVWIDVVDNGLGIPADQMDRVFERFYRVDKARSRELGGTGLGLAIVKHLAQSFGGDVAVSATPGGGSTFAVSLPTA
jgi:two-component system, OmpR family, phosphate regulon sensor histidine kinase PhoR